jgi:hypothetical protein
MYSTVEDIGALLLAIRARQRFAGISYASNGRPGFRRCRDGYATCLCGQKEIARRQEQATPGHSN